MSLNPLCEDTDLLDAEVWENPGWLSRDDLHDHDLNIHDGPGWRRLPCGSDDPEDGR